jgi:hypothetical protein
LGARAHRCRRLSAAPAVRSCSRPCSATGSEGTPASQPVPGCLPTGLLDSPSERRPASPGADRDRRRRRDARDRLAAASRAPRLERRMQRSGQPDLPTGLRADRQGLWPRVQPTAGGRGGASRRRRHCGREAGRSCARLPVRARCAHSASAERAVRVPVVGGIASSSPSALARRALFAARTASATFLA